MEWLLTHTALTQQGMRSEDSPSTCRRCPTCWSRSHTPPSASDALSAIDTAERQLQPARCRSRIGIQPHLMAQALSCKQLTELLLLPWQAQ